MENIFYAFLFILGTIFGSFGSVLIYRLKSGENGILFGRSHCQNCKKTLGFFELIPIFSWIKNAGKCKYCKTKIGKIYPALEISTGLAFLFSGIFLVDTSLLFSGNLAEIAKLIFWLGLNFITILYIFYDIIFLEINEKIMLSGIIIAFFGIFLNNFFEINQFLDYDKLNILNLFFSIILTLVILALFYIIMLKELDEKIDILILVFAGILLFLFYKYFGYSLENGFFNGIFGSYIIFLFFYLQYFFSGGKAIGGGDLRIGIMIGLILGIKFGLISIFLAYLIGSIIGIFILIKNKKQKKNKPNMIAFGPFLGLGFFSFIFASKEISNFILNNFFIM